MRKFQSIDPNGNLIQTFEFEKDEQILQKIDICHSNYEQFSQTSIQERQQKLLKLSELLESNCENDAKIISEEMGKPLQQAIGEVKKSAAHCRYYAENLEQFLQPTEFNVNGQKQQVYYESTGVIYIITPFNFPHFQIFKPAIANLALGNTVLVRTADSTPRVGLNIEQRFKEAGFENSYINIFSSPQQLELILSNKKIQGVNFTGSSGAGAFISQVAGKYLKKSVMELGGSDPFIVLEDADINQAVQLAVKGRLFNCGQVCCASKRFIIHHQIYEEFKQQLIQEVQKQKIGDPLEPTTQIGPMARADLVNSIDNQLKRAIEQGGRLLLGGEKLDQPGNYYKPAIIEIDNLQNILFNEETFGPIFPLYQYKNEKQAIQIANDTEYGLGSVVIGQSEHALKVAKKIKSGMTFVNTITASNSALPFGGIKRSGYGRECGIYGFAEFANTKLLWLE
ncbi:Aldehyde/histidinol dehydrogenase [Pseudocohnilembus persalinus]|uniref:Aldehyde/histidinol dehydrogenase n=1 Tax=Pseudocohnilembus persalinus TaxID=266149 RepID=A0A0V0QNA5_PSEPJ|nr:Aldehyde/histidinol dehydrogenase [Pseudocohnilembus persalinus]|eukprot:KRX03569.1 Aldehyde/histidinol dehydrogenase [Pseudocohnilembus persalinus]